MNISVKQGLALLLAAGCLAFTTGCGDDVSLDYLPLTVTTMNGGESSDDADKKKTTTTTPAVNSAISVTTTLPTVTEESKKTDTTTTPQEGEAENTPAELSDDEYLDASLFIGDSICSGFASYLDGYTAGENVLAYRDGRTTSMFNVSYNFGDESCSLDEAYSKSEAEFVYFLIGSNEISSVSAERFATLLENFISSVLGDDIEDKKIGLISLAPVGRGYKVSPTQVDAYNEAIKGVVEKIGDNAHYIDIHSALCDDEGYLLSEYDAGDGLHITTGGYKAASEAILASRM